MITKIQPAERLSLVSEYYFSCKLKEVAQLNAEGKDIISLAIGSPDMPPSEQTIEKLCEVAHNPNAHGYQPTGGTPELREAMADFYKTSLKCKYELNITSIPLNQVGHWRTTDVAIEHEAGRFFKVIAAQVEINNREVKTWCQPLVAPAQQGLTAFVIKKINGTYHFLVQGKVESGNFDTLEMAPTVQCITDSYVSIRNAQPFVDYVLNAKPEQIRVDTLQSEEGGRFYQEQNRNLIIEADDSFTVDNLPENYIWVSFQQLMLFLQFNNYLNIQSRSLISLISFVKN